MPDTARRHRASSKSTQLADIAERTGYSLATVSKVLNGRSDVAAGTRRIIEEALRDSGYSKSTQLADIAERTGYSLATVSKVLNGRSDVAAGTRRIIEEALRDSGYTKRISTTKNRKLIEAVFQNFDNIWSLEVLRGIVHEASAHEMSVVTTESGDRSHPDSRWVEGVLRRQPLGVVLIFSNLTESEKSRLQAFNIDYVTLDPAGDPSPDNLSVQLRRQPLGVVLIFSNLTESEKSRLQAFNIDYVTLDPAGDPSPDNLSVQADNWTGGIIATRHLLSLGHTRIGIITGPNSMLCSKARLDGYKAALDEHDIPFDPDLVREGDFSTAGGYLQGLSLLKNSDKHPTAIFQGATRRLQGGPGRARHPLRPRPGARRRLLHGRRLPAGTVAAQELRQTPHGHLRRQRPAVHGRLRGGAHAGSEDPRAAVRHRIRRRADGGAHGPGADHGPPAAAGHGRRGRAHDHRQITRPTDSEPFHLPDHADRPGQHAPTGDQRTALTRPVTARGGSSGTTRPPPAPPRPRRRTRRRTRPC